MQGWRAGSRVAALCVRVRGAVEAWCGRPERPAAADHGRTLVTCGAVLAVGALAVAAHTLGAVDDLAGLLVMAAAVVVLAASSVTIVPGLTVPAAASTLVSLAIALTFGPAGAVAAGVAEAAGAHLRLRTTAWRVGADAAALTLCNLGAWGAFSQVASLPVDHRLALCLAGLGAGLARLCLEALLVGTLVALASGTSPAPRIRRGLRGWWVAGVAAWGAVPFPPLHDRFGTLGLTWLLAPILGAQVLLVVLGSRARTHSDQRYELMELLQEQSIRVQVSHDATLVALTRALDARDPETEGHSRRVVEYTREIARLLGITGDDLTTLTHGALLHDIGKIGVPDAILHKPGALTVEEWEIMRGHPQVGAAMVADIEVLQRARLIILHHHEHWDGQGYPLGLRGTQITDGARVFAVADTVDAMTQDRPYHRGVSMDQAREQLYAFRGLQFDRDAVDAFLAVPEQRLLAIHDLRIAVDVDLLADHAGRRDRYLTDAGLSVARRRSA